jgi:hypothetical protein
MRKNIIDLFFRELDRRLAKPASVILTGAAAGGIYGNIRPSADIDFEIRLKSKRRGDSDEQRLQALIAEITSSLGIAANYSDNIGHWSMIDYLNYRQTALRYKKIGRMDIRLLAPEYWTIGKMTRFLEIDIDDMVKVIRKRTLRAAPLIDLWARALRASPLSLAKGRFRRNVEYFLLRYGKRLWGKSFDAEKAIHQFRRAARIKDPIASPL